MLAFGERMGCFNQKTFKFNGQWEDMDGDPSDRSEHGHDGHVRDGEGVCQAQDDGCYEQAHRRRAGAEYRVSKCGVKCVGLGLGRMWVEFFKNLVVAGLYWLT